MGSWSHSPHRIIPNTDIMMDFRAGKMLIEGRRVVPDTRKGIVRVRRGEDGLIHFQWLDRIQNTVVDDQIVFPDEAVFEKVSQSSERVYILRFKSDNRKFFFWMQEPNSDDDLHLCNAVNYYINRRDVIGPPDPEDPLDMPEMLEDAADDDLSSRAGNLVDQSMGNELVGEVSSSAGPVQLVDLQRILRNIQPAASVEDPDGGLGLGDILRPELIMPLIEKLPFEQELASYLPEGSCTPDILMELLQSPQFRQQVDTFTHVLQTGQIDLSQFGIDPSKYKFTVLSFLEALEDSVAKGLEDGGGVQSQRCSGGNAMDES